MQRLRAGVQALCNTLQPFHRFFGACPGLRNFALVIK
nr:MAG TPA: hypothetical protein [Caudoviricetes sp.]